MFNSNSNIHLQSQAAAAVAADSGKVGDSVVYLTNSAAGLRAQMTVAKSNSTNIKGIVAYSVRMGGPPERNLSFPPANETRSQAH
ncbi:hypothetical protein F4815DRAFT_461578 [Daldinia loculata]|nr:hypothetical protein F4815DRAFT_461578 [Daldinia loculata]